MQRLLAAGTLALAIGGACLGASSLAEDTEKLLYQYRSDGSAADIGGTERTPAVDQSVPKIEAQQSNAEFMFLEDYRDVVFSESTPEGVQTWHLIGGTTRTVKSPLRWFVIPGAALIFSAIGLFFMSYRTR